MRSVLPFTRGTLRSLVAQRTEQALACGALLPIETEQMAVEDHGIRFLVRKVSNLKRKDKERKKRGYEQKRSKRTVDPFLPYEKELFVADISETHLALLNKFKVIDHHLLIVTRAFEEQETLLNLSDFEALWMCMAEFDALGFYNGGVIAGASQPHKHLQMVPLPLAGAGPTLPIEPVLKSTDSNTGIRARSSLPFIHAFTQVDPALLDQPRPMAERTHACYRAMLEATGISVTRVDGKTCQSGPYNLLVTRRWMLLIPRRREFADSISINALGYAGSLFVRDELQMRTVQARGPMALLAEVAMPRRP
jgi:ATP adenylyltransferase